MEVFIQIIVYVFIIGVFIFNTWVSLLNYQHRNQPIPELAKDIYEPEKYQKWQNYHMENFRFGIITSSIDLVVILLLLIFGGFVWMNDIAENISSNIQLQTFIILAIYLLITFFIGIFTSYYRIFKIEGKYGFNKATKKTFAIDKIKTFLISGLIVFGLTYLLTYLYVEFKAWFILFAWIVVVIIIFLINILYANVFIHIFNKLTPLEDGELRTKIFAFAEKVGYKVSSISVMNASKRSSKLNAFFSGFGKFKKIVLYDTLIEKCTDEEIVAVLAHEIGHYKYKHIISNLVRMIIGLSIYILLLYLVLTYKTFSTAFGFNDANFAFSVIIFTILLSPLSIVINLFTTKISRKFEYQADEYSAINYSKEQIISALKVLTRENFSNLTPHPFYVKLYYTHPPIVERIKAINKIK